ncbi:MAG: hypothetical protein JWO38_2075 [Gemmataceae bacterium]|nr:hypothetical protein [Gemmataceae bacterium]
MSQSIIQPDAIDSFLSDFFKSRMRHPWPAAPVPVSAQPSALVAPRVASSQMDTNGRARITLAASVALLIGTCWYLSNGWQSADRSLSKPGQGGGPNVLPESTAESPGAFEKNRKDKASQTKDPMAGFQPGPITLP